MSQRVPMMDCSDSISRADNGYLGKGPVAKTGNYTVKTAETGTTFTNKGAGAGVTFTLPAPKAGMYFRFAVVAAQTLTVQASGGAKINNSAANGTYAAAGTQALTGNAMVWSDGANWYVGGASGSWTTT